jgi:hypothetical protein
MGVGGDPDFLLLIGILTFLPIKSPYKILEPYDNPFWGFEQRYQDSGGYEKKIQEAMRRRFRRL